MSKKHFSWLLGLTIAAAAIVLLIPGKTGKESSFERGRLLPGLAAKVNELDSIRLTAGGGETVASFERLDVEWRVQEVSSYPADWGKLKSLLSDLSRAEVIEEKTSNPEYYARLGVEDITLDDASGMMIEFAEASGMPALIVGKQATGREGQYVRIAGVQSSALIDVKLDLPADRMQWLERDIIDISDSEVVELSITHPDGELISATKKSADDEDFQLQGIPPEREIKSNWSVNSIGGGLAALKLDSVVPESEIDWSEVTKFSLLTADGLRVSADLAALDEAYWIRIQSEAYTPAVEESGPEDDASSAASAELAGRVNQINDRVNGWAYQIPQNKYDAMSKRMEDLLKPTEGP